MKKIYFSFSVLLCITVHIAASEKYVYYERVFPDSSDIRTSFSRTKEAEFFESKGGAGECFNLSYQFETAYKFYTYHESETIENVKNPPSFYRDLLEEAKHIKRKRQMESERMENLRSRAYLCNAKFKYPDERPEYFVHLNTVFFVSGVQQYYSKERQRYVLCQSTGEKIFQRLNKKFFYNPYLIRSVSDKGKYFLLYDQKKTGREIAYSLYSVKMSSDNSGKLLLQGRINSSKTDKRDNTGIRVMDRKALNQTQTLILKYSSNELLLFDHMDQKLYTLHKFPKNKKVFLTREMTLRYVAEHFSYEDEKVFSSEAMSLILLKNKEFQSNDYTILNFEKGNIKLQDFKPVYDLMDVFTLENELYIDVSYLKVYSDKKVSVE